MNIRQARPADEGALQALMTALWPDCEPETAAEALAEPRGAVFLAEEQGAAVGFMQCVLRRDYVEGASQSPTGYLEGAYVSPPWRRRGAARALAAACEDWARARGCAEIGSDCELDNTLSPLFHAAAGFEEVNRVICFLKRL